MNIPQYTLTGYISLSNDCGVEKDNIDLVLSNLRPCTTEEKKKIVSKSPSKSYSLDPIPTELLEQCSDTLLPVIKDIINIFIGQGTVPDLFKVAHVKPLLKKVNFNPDDMKNYRPISNVSFISKLTEKVVSARLHEQIALNGLAEKTQNEQLF